MKNKRSFKINFRFEQEFNSDSSGVEPEEYDDEVQKVVYFILARQSL